MDVQDSPFIDALRAFDSHERGILLQWATSQFRLDRDLCASLGDLCRTPVPDNAFVAMDYTLDWLYAALHFYRDPDVRSGKVMPRPEKKQIRASQEDIDLLI